MFCHVGYQGGAMVEHIKKNPPIGISTAGFYRTWKDIQVGLGQGFSSGAKYTCKTDRAQAEKHGDARFGNGSTA